MSYQTPRGFLRGIELSHFMDTHAEFHAFALGLCEVLCPWPPRHKDMSQELKDQLTAEHHYYMLGRTAGVLAWIALPLFIWRVVV